MTDSLTQMFRIARMLNNERNIRPSLDERLVLFEAPLGYRHCECTMEYDDEESLCLTIDLGPVRYKYRKLIQLLAECVAVPTLGVIGKRLTWFCQAASDDLDTELGLVACGRAIIDLADEELLRFHTLIELILAGNSEKKILTHFEFLTVPLAGKAN